MKLKLQLVSANSPNLSDYSFGGINTQGATPTPPPPTISSQLDFSQPANIVFFSMGF